VRRWDFIAGLGAAVVPVAAGAQQSKGPVIGFLDFGSPETNNLAAFRKGLSETGYVEGRNLTIEYRFAYNERDRLPELAADLVRSRVAVIAAWSGAVVAPAVKAATTTIPIVFQTGDDPVEVGLVASFNRPGGNVTGVTSMNTEIFAKRLELLHTMVPGAKRSALLVGSYALFYDRRVQIFTLAARHAVPASYSTPGFVHEGGLMSYGSSYLDMTYQGGIIVGRILKGEKPADLPVRRPTKFELVINLKTAKALGLTIPETLLATADEVIQ
jgi:putative ABC transport system substrate-binding protein